MTLFEDIVNDYKPFIYKISRAYTKHETDFEDLCQEMYFQIWHSLDSFKEQSALSTWVYRICLNTALSYQKKEKKRKQSETDINRVFRQNRISSKENENEDIERGITILLDCIKQLKPIDKSIMLLYLEEQSYDEIAETLGISSSNVGTKINRLKPKLLKCIKNKGYAR